MGNEPENEIRQEPRWPAVLAILAVLLLLQILPGRIRLFPALVSYLLALVVLVPIAGAALTRGKKQWLQIERTVTLLFAIFSMFGTLANLWNMISMMLRYSDRVSGLQLLTSSIAVWVTNVLLFSLAYWQLDRAGPGARANSEKIRPDWLFPQTGVPEEAPPDWQPAFMDYLFLAYSTATAFSPTDALPLTTRAKVLMMLESMISLATILVVAARAINILGS